MLSLLSRTIAHSAGQSVRLASRRSERFSALVSHSHLLLNRLETAVENKKRLSQNLCKYNFVRYDWIGFTEINKFGKLNTSPRNDCHCERSEATCLSKALPIQKVTVLKKEHLHKI
jgi:hypothetical protein